MGTRLRDKVVLITGAGSGLGRESALLFAEEGATVVLTDIDDVRLKDATELVSAVGADCTGIVADVREDDALSEAFDQAVARYGRVDVAFANAGVRGRRQGAMTVDEVTQEDWHDVLDTNLTGAIFTVKHAVRVMKPRGSGSIVVTSSAAALRAYPLCFLYAATKGALNSFVRTVAVDVGRFGIRVNAICPTHGMSPNFLLPKGAPVVGRSYEETTDGWTPETSPIPLRIGRPPSLRDNANAALFLASDDSAFISGQCLPTADGGTLVKVAMDFGNAEDGVPKYAWFEGAGEEGE